MIFKRNDCFTHLFRVTASIHNGFINLFDDRNPLHLSGDFAIAKGFNGRVMHGNILGGFISYFVGECLPSKSVIIHSQEIQFKNPIYLDEELTFEAVIVEFYESVNVVEFKFSFKNSDNLLVARGKIRIGLLS